jgi:predicted O-methyltransferase YrrM
MNNFDSEIMKTIPVISDNMITKFYDKVDKDSLPFFSYKIYSIVRAATECKVDGDWAEFGVWRGTTGSAMLDLLPKNSHLYLLDSFEGLQEDWFSYFKKGFFKLDEKNRPKFDDPRVSVVPGFFKDTKEVFKNKTISFAHIDCDLYSSTVDALNAIDKCIIPGTILLFDEYVHKIGNDVTDDEHRAFSEWINKTNRSFEYLWRTEWTQVCIKIKE